MARRKEGKGGSGIVGYFAGGGVLRSKRLLGVVILCVGRLFAE
jgi:hypothetical protein